MARVKPQLAVATRDDADSALARIAEIRRGLAAIDARYNRVKDAAKARAKRSAEPLRDELGRLESGLAAWAHSLKAELFSGRKRSIDLPHGRVGFRVNKVLTTLKKVTWKQVLANLKDMAADLRKLGLPSCVRVREEVDREALRTLNEAMQARAGVELKADDEFYYDPKQEQIAERAA